MPPIDDTVERIRCLGRGTALAKFDIASAYRIVPVHPVDRMLWGMMWEGKLYVDGVLKLYTVVADRLLWIVGRDGITNILHYLDDFLLLVSSRQFKVALQTTLSMCKALGVPIANHKVEVTAMMLPYWHRELHTETSTRKVERLKWLMKSWQGRKSCKKRRY